MTVAAIAGTFCTYRHVPSRGVVQLVVEIAVEHQAAAFEALGYPEPGKSLHVAVARLNNAQNADTISDNAHREEVMPPATTRPGGTNQTVIDTPPPSQTLGAGAHGTTAEGGESPSALVRVAPSDGVSGQGSSATGGAISPARPCSGPVAPEGDENRGARAVRAQEAKVLRDWCEEHNRGHLPDGLCPECEERCATRIAAVAQGSSRAARADSNGPPSVSANPVAPEGDENRGTRAVKRAVMLCKDPEFQVFAGTTWSAARDNPVACETHAADFLRTGCQIASRRDLAHDERARKAFEALCTEYDLWRGRIAEIR